MVESEIGLTSRLPVGEAARLEEFIAQNWQEHLTVFSPVRNKVLAVNEDVYSPFPLIEGKASPLGVFAHYPPQYHYSRFYRGLKLETYEGHGRTAILGRILFSDKQGRVYRAVDLKGIGMVGPGGVCTPGRHREGGRTGVLDEGSAFSAWQASENVLSAGIRTPRVLAIIGLEQLVVDGKKWGLVKAIERDIIDSDFKPVILVRAFVTRARVGDPYHYPHLGKLLLSDAKKMVEQETGEEMTLEGFFEWFGKTFGGNVAAMHNMGLYHSYLTPHNITLDCRLVDFDSVQPIESWINQRDDYIKAADTMDWMGENVVETEKQSEILVNSFGEGYEATFREDALEGWLESQGA